jgi:serine protease Do
MKKIASYRLALLFTILSSTLTPVISTASEALSMPPSLAPMLNAVMPAIVNISVQGELPGTAADDESEQQRLQQTPNTPAKPRKFEGLASGVIIDPEHGFIITNAHVIKNSSVINVTLHDGRHFTAKMLGLDPATDIAVVQIKAKHLQSLPLSDSNQLHVGDFAVAIGNPFGLNSYGTNQTATFGIISALGRSMQTPGSVSSFIQTDAAINPGNSGGALVNTKGELIGINTGIVAASPLSGNVGIGLAIPINMARTIMEQLIKYGSIHRGLMGIFVQHITPELASAFHLPNTDGGLVTQVNSGSPAAFAGLKAGDVITKINDQVITEAAQVKNIIGLLRVGSKANIEIFRDGKTSQLSVEVADVKGHEEKQQAQNPFLFGLALRNFELLDDAAAQGLIKGVQIVAISETSPAWRAGLVPADVITSANNQVVNTTHDLEKIATQSKNQLLLHVRRGGGSLYFLVK